MKEKREKGENQARDVESVGSYGSGKRNEEKGRCSAALYHRTSEIQGDKSKEEKGG